MGSSLACFAMLPGVKLDSIDESRINVQFFTSRKAGQHVLLVEEGQGGGVESFCFLEKNYEKIIRKNLIFF